MFKVAATKSVNLNMILCPVDKFLFLWLGGSQFKKKLENQWRIHDSALPQRMPLMSLLRVRRFIVNVQLQ